MRFYRQPRRFYVGIDLHARSLYLCILNTPQEKVTIAHPSAVRSLDFFGHVAVRQ